MLVENWNDVTGGSWKEWYSEEHRDLLQGVEEVKCICMFATIAKCSYSSWLLFSCDAGSQVWTNTIK